MAAVTDRLNGSPYRDGQSSRVEVPTGEPASSPCCSCTRPSFTSEKALKVFASIFFAAVVAITVTSLIVNYPKASTAFYSVFGTTTFVSIVALAIATYRHWTKGKDGEVLNMTAEKAMKVFAAIFVLSIIAVTVNAVIVNYPQASTAIYSIFSIAGSASFIALCVLLAKKCLGGDEVENDLGTDGIPATPVPVEAPPPQPTSAKKASPAPAGPTPTSARATPASTRTTGGAYDGSNPFVANET